MKTYDVLFMANHFVMVTTVQMHESPDKRDMEKVAWKRLADEYGDEWVDSTKSFINQVSIEEVPSTSADKFNTVPEPGDPEDAGIDRD